MTVRRTIAILGEIEKFCPALAERLAQQTLRLLFVSGDEKKNAAKLQQLLALEPSAEIEFINCEKEGCWEADIIGFTGLEEIEPQLIRRIKQVATQKIVMMISEVGADVALDLESLENLLPHSQVVRVVLDSQELVVSLMGEMAEAKTIVGEIFTAAGFQLK